MAGSFGYERDNTTFRLPAVSGFSYPRYVRRTSRPSSWPTVFSCKEQIEQQTSRHALHLAEVMQMQHNDAEENAPETSIVDRRLLGPEKIDVGRRQS